jgi:tetratricopeptide (TPR) repeat protein
VIDLTKRGLAHGAFEARYFLAITQGGSMLVQAAEARFQKGLLALDGGRHLEALALFEAALELERRLGAHTPQARYLSYYGLCLARDGNHLREGADFCRQAIALEFFNADLFWNLGRVLLLSDRRKDAFAAFVKGLSVQKNHQEILRELGRMGWRRPPVLGFLPRNNALNIALGKLLRPATRGRTPRTA